MAKGLVKVAKTSDIAVGCIKVFEIEDISIAVCNVGGEFYAVENVCTHDDAPLGEGTLIGKEIECPRHRARFDVTTGAVTRLPAYAPLRTFPVIISESRSAFRQRRICLRHDWRRRQHYKHRYFCLLNKGYIMVNPDSDALAAPIDVVKSYRDVLNVDEIRKDFPILGRMIKGYPIVYLDSAATTQKPASVINALSFFYRTSNANIHRGAHTLSEESSSAYEQLREKVAQFIGSSDARGIVITRNATESLNLVARSWGKAHITSGDEIILTEMEHHSNLIPWQLLAKETGAVLKFIKVTDDGYLDMKTFYELLSRRTKIVGVTLVSNVLGTINPVEEIIQAAHKQGVVVVLDGAQGVPHMKVNVQELDCDFLAFSAHKMLGPTGIGVLYAKPEILETMEPMLGGGGMIKEVTLESATWADIPWRFEAGTPNYADVIAFSSAIDYLDKLGMDNIRIHEEVLTTYTLERFGEFKHMRIYGPMNPKHKAGVVTFYDEYIHPHDLSTILDSYGIAIRAGHHCAQPLMRKLGVEATARASFYVYNDLQDIDALIEGLHSAREFFKYGSQ